MNFTVLILLLLFSYLLGSIPSGFLLSKFAGHGDIRKTGSGNIGATNVLRTGNKLLALLTLFFDGAKSSIAVWVTWTVLTENINNVGMCQNIETKEIIPCNFGLDTSDYALLLVCGLFAVIGHSFPVWLKFKGGKGVATSLGVLLAAVPYAGLAACLTWLVAAFVFKISSLAALTALLVAPLVTLFIYGPFPALVAFCISLLVFWRHKDNIKRLLKGEEPKISFGKKKNEPTANSK